MRSIKRSKITFKQKMTPESLFIRTGKITPNFNPAKARALGSRFLSRTWVSGEKEKKPKWPLPTFRQRIYGGKLPKVDQEAIEGHTQLVVEKLCTHFDNAQKIELMRKINALMPGQMISIRSLIRNLKSGNVGLKTSRKWGKELFIFLKETGRICRGLISEATGRTYYIKGWRHNKTSVLTPIHEGVHLLQFLGAIKVDVPFAEAAERLHGLESGLFKVESLKPLKMQEFDKIPQIDKELSKKRGG